MFGLKREARLRSLAAVLAAHVLLAWFILTLTGPSILRERTAALDVFDVRPVPPPPPVEPPVTPIRAARHAVTPKPEGAAATGRAPPAPVRLVSLEVSRQLAAPARPAASGAAPVASMVGGGGTGGSGAGLSGRGSGAGGGTPAVPARLTSGRIQPRDYPRAAAGAQGSVTVHLRIGTSGAVTGCTVARSSGNAVLDATTCRLIRERFRYAPARTADGRAVTDLVGWRQRWWRD
jgi:protein TonB